MVYDRHAWIIFHSPTSLVGGAAESDFLVIKEKILVHAPDGGDHRGVHEHARAGHPIYRAGPNSPTGLVFPAGARYELLPDGPGKAWEGPHGALRRAVAL